MPDQHPHAQSAGDTPLVPHRQPAAHTPRHTWTPADHPGTSAPPNVPHQPPNSSLHTAAVVSLWAAIAVLVGGALFTFKVYSSPLIGLLFTATSITGLVLNSVALAKSRIDRRKTDRLLFLTWVFLAPPALLLINSITSRF